MGIINISQSTWTDNNPYTGISQSDTLVSPAVHFWDMHETGSPSFITDIINGATITCALTPQVGGIYIRAEASIASGQAIAGGYAIGQDDFMLLTVAESVGTGDDNGHTGFYWQGSGSTFKNHPYYALAGQSIRTIPYNKNLIRTVGDIYTHALVRRGTVIEHYCLPRGFIDSFDLIKYGLFDHYLDTPAPLITSLGHGGYGTPANDGAGHDFGLAVQAWDNSGDVAQDYAGLAVYVFENGAPDKQKLVKCLHWCQTEWTTKSSGKRLYPGFL